MFMIASSLELDDEILAPVKLGVSRILLSLTQRRVMLKIRY